MLCFTNREVGISLAHWLSNNTLDRPRAAERLFCPFQEMEIIGLAIATLLSKYRKIATFDELVDRLFFLGKSAVAILLYFVGVPHAVSYVILWAGMFYGEEVYYA